MLGLQRKVLIPKFKACVRKYNASSRDFSGVSGWPQENKGSCSWSWTCMSGLLRRHLGMTAIPGYESAGREQLRPAFRSCLGCLPPPRPQESFREIKGSQRSLGTVGNSRHYRSWWWLDWQKNHVGMTVPAVSRDLGSSPTVLCHVKVRHFDFLPLLGIWRQKGLVGMSCLDVFLYNAYFNESEFPLTFLMYGKPYRSKPRAHPIQRPSGFINSSNSFGGIFSKRHQSSYHRHCSGLRIEM